MKGEFPPSIISPVFLRNITREETGIVAMVALVDPFAVLPRCSVRPRRLVRFPRLLVLIAVACWPLPNRHRRAVLVCRRLLLPAFTELPMVQSPLQPKPRRVLISLAILFVVLARRILRCPSPPSL